MRVMTLESLLLSRDENVISVLRPTLEKLSIDVDVCRGVASGTKILTNEKFDAVIVDCDDLNGGLDVLAGLRKGTSNRNSVAFAILNGTTTTHRAFELGANFVLQKPVSALNATRCFEAALGFMARERRRYFRQPVEMPVTIFLGAGEEMKARGTDLSEGGMAVQITSKIPKSGISKVSFTLPGSTISMEPKAELAWADDQGRVGIRFRDIPQNSRDQLEGWIAEQMKTSQK
jgi:CheY-like chemotaxis protein